MARASLQWIQDSYERHGLSGAALRIALAKDERYQRILASRMRRLRATVGVSAAEKRRYVLSLDQDFEILALVRALERKRLSAPERAVVRLARTQLEREWRKHLLRALRRIARAHQSR